MNSLKCKTQSNKIKNNEKINFEINNTSPLRYPGGKTRACKILDKILIENFDINKFNNIVSPFFGGGSFEFYLQNKYKFNIIANDKFTPLYSFWSSCKDNKTELCNELYQYLDKIDKDKFLMFRKNIMNEDDMLKKSIMYFIINRCSFSGATLSGGFSLESSKKRFTKSSIDRINELNLINFNINNIDFEEFIEKNIKNENLLFLDPPYYLEKNSKLYGNNGDMHEYFEHTKLYNCLKNKSNWIMTYNNCEFIKNLYKDFKILDVNWSYGMNKTKESSEIIIINV